MTVNRSLLPSRVDQHAAIGMAMERSATTRLKDALVGRLAGLGYYGTVKMPWPPLHPD